MAMLILGIETSCDETAAAVAENGTQILSNVVASQIKLHAKTGGVVPEVAAREHVVKITSVIEEALKKAKITLREIDAIAVTAGPGLLSSLLIGVNAAMTLSLVHKKPLIPVNHVEGHIYANWLDATAPKFPIVTLTVSGGHNDLVLMRGHCDYKVLGSTLDDAAGEAFDKVARLLGLGYPGGPEIEKAAKKGDPAKFPFPRAWVTGFDFSFSGLKTSVLYLLKKQYPKFLHSTFHILHSNIAASFQEAVCEVLATKLVNASIKFHAKEAHLAGGVSANSRLREWVKKLLPQKIKLRFCEKISLCTDNAAMIAAAGYYEYKKNPRAFKKWQPIIADPNLVLR